MKIKLYKHTSTRATIDDDIQKTKDYFVSDFVKQFIPDGIDLVIDTEKTNLSKQDIMKLVSPNIGKYDCVMYLFEKGYFPMDYWGYTFNATEKMQVIILASDIPSDKIDYTWKAMAHELLHALTYKLVFEKKIPYNDSWNLLDHSLPTPYFHNDDPFFPQGNFYQQLNKIAPLLHSPTVILTRTSGDEKQTLGYLVYKKFTCKTLERGWLNNQKNISCIPTGTYLCKYTWSPKFLKGTYEIQNVKNRSGIRIHSGNYFFDINGCILLGDSYKDINKDGEVDVLNSRATIKTFEDLLLKQQFNLIIQ